MGRAGGEWDYDEDGVPGSGAAVRAAGRAAVAGAQGADRVVLVLADVWHCGYGGGVTDHCGDRYGCEHYLWFFDRYMTSHFLGFPVLIIALIPLRWKILPKIFTAKELRVMDAPTADSEIVLASMGGKPQVPGGEDDEVAETESVGTRNSAEAQEEKWSSTESAVPREGLRERGGGWSEA